MKLKIAVETRDIILIGLFAALMAALGLLPKIPLPLGVPITAQSMGVMLAGAILGAWRGGAAMALFVLLVAMGLPLLAGGRGGLGLFAGPTGGFIIGFVVGAYVTGYLCERLRKQDKFWPLFLACLVGGVGAVYAIGVPYWVMITDSTVAAVLAIAVNFLPGDLVKAAVAAGVAVAVRRGYPVIGRK